MTSQNRPGAHHRAAGPLTTTGGPEARPRPLVLVVDDAGTVRSYHRSILADAGFEVHEAANGYEALETALTTHFDLLIVDVNMPVMDGFTLVRAIRSEAANAGVPIVMVSSENQSVDADQAYRSGANVYLVKPVDPDQLTLTARLLTGQATAEGAEEPVR